MFLIRASSPNGRCTSSKSSTTNRAGRTSGAGAFSESAGCGELVSDNDCGVAGGVSTEKCEMSWSLRSSKTRKSSWCKLGTAWPCASRTTTRIGTRFTRTEKGVDESRVFISCAVSEELDGGGVLTETSGDAGCGDVVSWVDCARREAAGKAVRNKPKRKAGARRDNARYCVCAAVLA